MPGAERHLAPAWTAGLVDGAEISVMSRLLGEGTRVARRLGRRTRRWKSSYISGLDKFEGSTRGKDQTGRALVFRSGHVEFEFSPRGPGEGILSRWA